MTSEEALIWHYSYCEKDLKLHRYLRSKCNNVVQTLSATYTFLTGQQPSILPLLRITAFIQRRSRKTLGEASLP